MNVFDLDRALVTDYEKFARSFTEIRAPDIRQQIDAIYATGRFWPEALITVNPHFERGASIEELVANGTLCAETGRIFRIEGQGARTLSPSSPGNFEGRRQTKLRGYDRNRFGKVALFFCADH